MWISTPFGRLRVYAVWCSAMLAMGDPSPAAAQTRTAGIKVEATVRSVTESDILGAHALAAPSPAPSVGSVQEADAWRIVSGRSSSVAIRVEGTESVTICEAADEALKACEPYRAPWLQTRPAGRLPQFVVRVAQPAADGPAVTPVRLTVAFIDF